MTIVLNDWIIFYAAMPITATKNGGRAIAPDSHFNDVRTHRTLLMTPAMAANVSSRLWSLEELVDRTSN